MKVFFNFLSQFGWPIILIREERGGGLNVQCNSLSLVPKCFKNDIINDIQNILVVVMVGFVIYIIYLCYIAYMYLCTMDFFKCI